MDATNEIALIQSKTFWTALLSLVSIIAGQFNWTSVAGFATDPATVTNILNIVAMVGAVGAIVGRTVATSKVGGVISTGK